MRKLDLKIYKKYINDNDIIYDVYYLVFCNDYSFNVFLGRVDDFGDVLYYCEISNNGKLIYPRL